MLLDLIALTYKYDMKIKGVLHVGAHHGQENKFYDFLSIKNRMFFEPLSSNFSKLKENVGEEFTLVNKALGNQNTMVEMYVEVANQGQSSSVLKPAKHLEQYPHIQFPAKEKVEMVRLDDLEINSNDFNFINIDVQGYELEVFKGAEKTLNGIDYIMAEINRDELYENCAKVDELIEFLGSYGFKLVETDWAGGTWGDGLFIKQNQS